VKFSDSSKLEDFLDGTAKEVESAKNHFMKAVVKKGKDAVKRHIPRTVGVRRHAGRKRMVDDVQASLVEDKKFGGKRVRIRGGRQTGPLWHIVDKGTYRSRGTRFIGKAMTDIDNQIDPALDAAMREELR